VTVAAAFSTFDENAAGQSRDTTNIGVAYRMGAFTFRGGWSSTESESNTANGVAGVAESPMFVLGVQYAFSPTLNGRFGYYNLDTENAAGTTIQERKQFLVALDYYLSKRTTAYVLLDRLDVNTGTVNLGGAQSGALLDGATGISAGIAHSF
jgi:predicted porin